MTETNKELAGRHHGPAAHCRRPAGQRAGRPVWWALTIGGPGGIARLMDYFNRELVNTMLHLGVDKIAAIGRQHVLRTNG